MTTSRGNAQNAENTVIYFAVGGLVTAVLGWILATSQWPNNQGYEHQGSALVAYLGAAMCALGQLALLVAVVAYGARLGVRWSGLLDRETEALEQPATRSYLDEDGL